jgi:hypothetical protein
VAPGVSHTSARRCIGSSTEWTSAGPDAAGRQVTSDNVHFPFGTRSTRTATTAYMLLEIHELAIGG